MWKIQNALVDLSGNLMDICKQLGTLFFKYLTHLSNAIRTRVCEYFKPVGRQGNTLKEMLETMY